jgi:hypothetical protein
MATRSDITLADPLFVDSDQTVVIDSAKGDDGLPLDCGSFALRFVVKHHPDDADAVIDVSGAAITKTNGEGVNDKITILISKAQAAVIKRRRYRYSLRRTNVGQEYPISYGLCDVEKTVAV